LIQLLLHCVDPAAAAAAAAAFISQPSPAAEVYPKTGRAPSPRCPEQCAPCVLALACHLTFVSHRTGTRTRCSLLCSIAAAPSGSPPPTRWSSCWATWSLRGAQWGAKGLKRGGRARWLRSQRTIYHSTLWPTWCCPCQERTCGIRRIALATSTNVCLPS
jgi:hypothetical protein